MQKLKILLQSNGFYLLLFLLISLYVFFITQVIPLNTHSYKDKTEIKGTLFSYDMDNEKVHLYIKEQEKIRVVYYFKNEEEKNTLANTLKIGLTLHIIGKEQTILSPTIPNTFNYKKYLEYQKIYHTFTASKIEILKSKIGLFNTIKNKIDERLKSLGNNSYLRAFIIGDKSLIEEEEYKKIMENGVGHLFALSGMHLSFVYLFFKKLFSKVKYQNVLIYSFLFLYLFITGFSVSFFRAILFLILMDLNCKMHLNISSYKILLLTAFFLLLYNPFYLYNVGFWYTFVVTFSLLYTGKELKGHSKIGQVFGVSLVTFLFSMPISLFIRYEINLFSILCNIILVPFISAFVFPFAILTFLFPIFLPIFRWAISILEFLNTFFQKFSLFIIFGKIHFIDLFVFYLFLLIGFKTRNRNVLVLFFLFLIFLYNKNIFESDYQVYFLDVNQGDSTLFVAPHMKEAILIDTGGLVSFNQKPTMSIGENITTFLKSIRVRKIDLLIITHGDYDHIGYASLIGKSIPFKNVMLNEGDRTKEEQELSKKYPIVKEYNSKYFDFETIFLKVYSSENDNSILTKIKIYDKTFLLMGDASSTVENDFLLKDHQKVDFLKVAHHGSKTSSFYTFLKTIQPKYAIISSGRNNLYHHPAQETIERLKKLKITYYNTQDDGTIIVRLNKKGMRLKTLLS